MIRIYYSPSTNQWCAEATKKKKIMRDLEGSIFEMWRAASSMLKTGDSGLASFDFNEFEYNSPDFDVFWSASENSYLISCSGGDVVKTERCFSKDKVYNNIVLISDQKLSLAGRGELLEDFLLQVNRLKEAFP